MKKYIFALIKSTLHCLLIAGTTVTACKEDGDEPEIFNDTTWYPVRTVGEYVIWDGSKISYDLPVGADGLAILYYEQKGEQKTYKFGFPVYEFYMKKGKNVYNANYLYAPEASSFMRERGYYIEGNYIFFEKYQPNYSSSSVSGGDKFDFSPKPLTIFSADSIRIGNAYYKKR